VLGYEKMLDEHGREMHGSWGNLILAEEAFDRMGADVMRWQYCQQTPDRNILFGYGPAYEIKKRFLRFWHSIKFFVDLANVEGFEPSWNDGAAPSPDHPLDRWLVERTRQLAAEATAAYEEYLTHRVVDAFESYVEDLSTWYIRRSRPRFYSENQPAFATLWWSIVQSLRVIAPLAPFLADHLWRNLVPDGPESVHLAGWPELGEPDEALLAEMAEVRRITDLGRQARGDTLPLRQPLRQMFVRGATLAKGHAAEIADELNVKEVLFDEGPVARVQLKPNLPLLGPRLGAKLRDVSAALAAGEYEELGEGRVRAGGEELAADEVIRGERLSVDGFVMADDEVISVALSTELDDELRREKRVRDLIRRVNQMRKDEGLEITDRIRLTLPGGDEDLVSAHGDWIKQETLAVELQVDGAGLQIEKV
jgi:isoleucyl-tRNA synthetase